MPDDIDKVYDQQLGSRVKREDTAGDSPEPAYLSRNMKISATMHPNSKLTP